MTDSIHPSRRILTAVADRLKTRDDNANWRTVAEDRVRDSRLLPPLDAPLKPTVNVFAFADDVTGGYGGDGFAALDRVLTLVTEPLVSGTDAGESRLAALMLEIESALAFWSPPGEESGVYLELQKVQWGDQKIGEHVLLGATMQWRAKYQQTRPGAENHGVQALYETYPDFDVAAEGHPS